MSEIRTWDDMVAAVQEAHPDPIAWQEIDATLRALRAIGLAIVPREATEEMVNEAWDAHADGAPCEILANVGQIYQAITAALTAGEIAPPPAEKET